MEIKELLRFGVPEFVVCHFKEKGIDRLNSPQVKAIGQGLLEDKNMLICTPTGSGKTAIATFAITKSLCKNRGSKAIYLVPLKSLANEKYKDYQDLFKESGFNVMIHTGDIDSRSEFLANYDLLILTIEKMDSLLRHNVSWIKDISIIIFDEIHLLNDTERGPTLEVLITILKQSIKDAQIIALSATIGNAEELAEWLHAELVVDDWRPVKLHKGIYFKDEIKFF